MKKLLLVVLALILVIGTFAGCKSEAKYEDGVYFAQESFTEDSSWKYMVTLVVEDGKITEVEWNGANKAGGTDKKTRSEDGAYGMVERGGAQAEWHEQAAKVEAYLLDKQDPAKIEYTDDEGHTDDIAGVSIHVVEFFDLVEEALENGPVGYGMYKDGAYSYAADEFSHGWKTTVDATVVSGYLVAVNWNALPEEGEKDKKTASADGDYGMVANGGAQSEWHEQVALAEAFVLENQTFDINYIDEDGHTDEITGVSIHVNDMYDVLNDIVEKR